MVSAREKLLEYMKILSGCHDMPYHMETERDFSWGEQEDGTFEAYLASLIDAFAHELAEKLRAWNRNWEDPAVAAAIDEAADYIDPEVNAGE